MDHNNSPNIQSDTPKETHNQTIKGLTSQLLTARNYILLLMTIIALSIAYYFFIALPHHNSSMLQLERDKFKATQDAKTKEEQEKERKELLASQEAESKKLMLAGCLNAADQSYWEYIKLNGTPVKGKKGVYTAPQYIWEMANKQKKEAIDECYREWNPK